MTVRAPLVSQSGNLSNLRTADDVLGVLVGSGSGVGGIDTTTAGALNIGHTTATSLAIGDGAAVTGMTIGGGAGLASLALGSGMGAGDTLDLGGAGSVTTVKGDLKVEGTTVTIESQTVLVEDNHLYLNQGYETASAETGGLVVNYLPIATTGTVTGAYVAGIPAGINPSVTIGASVFAAGQFIQFSGSTNNDGLYEVLSDAAGTLTIKGIGSTATVEDFTQNQFVAGASDGATISRVTVSVIRAGTDGAWETGAGATTPLTFSDLATAAGSTLQTAYVAGNTITTSLSDGDVTVNGNQDFIVGGSVDVSFTTSGTINQSGSGQVTFTGNLDADGAIDVTGDSTMDGHLTFGQASQNLRTSNSRNLAGQDASSRPVIGNSTDLTTIDCNGEIRLDRDGAGGNLNFKFESNLSSATIGHVTDTSGAGGSMTMTAQGGFTDFSGGSLNLNGGAAGGAGAAGANGGSVFIYGGAGTNDGASTGGNIEIGPGGASGAGLNGKIDLVTGDFAIVVTVDDNGFSAPGAFNFSVTSTGTHTFSGADMNLDEDTDFGGAITAVTASGNPTWNFGTGQADFGGNLDANLGLDVLGGNLTVGNGLTIEGQGNFTIEPQDQPTLTSNGFVLWINSGAAGDADSGSPGGTAGLLVMTGGAGGDGGAGGGETAGAGGQINITGGAAGADGGVGGAVGGAVLVAGGAGTTTGGAVSINAGAGTTTDGAINIGTTTANAITFGNTADDPDFTFQGDGEVIVNGDAVRYVEQAADPGATANSGKVYTKDVSSVTELFYQDSGGTVTQLTGVSGAGEQLIATDITIGGGVGSGDAVYIDGSNSVDQGDASAIGTSRILGWYEGTATTVTTAGVVESANKTTGAGTAIAVGGACYLSETAGEVTGAVPAANVSYVVGIAMVAAADGAATVKMYIAKEAPVVLS
jgi:hypothetical protein